MRAAPTVASFREDPPYPRIAQAVSAILVEGKVVAPVDVLVRMGLVEMCDLQEWRMGRVPFLEKVIDCNLTRLGRLPRFRAYKPKRGEVRFDMFEAELTQEGELVHVRGVFDRFGWQGRRPGQIAEIVHQLDVHDGKFEREDRRRIRAAS